MRFIERSSARLAEENHTIGVGALGIVIHSPAVSGLGKLLIVDEDEDRLQASFHSTRQRGLFQLYLAASNFSHLKGNVAAGPEDAMELAKNFGHGGLPLL